MFANALGSLDAKDKQKQNLKRAYDSFTNNYWTVETYGNPEINTNSNTPDVVTISIPVKVQINEGAIQPFFNDLNRLSEGTEDFGWSTTILDNKIKLYTENRDWMFKYARDASGNSNRWFL